MGADFRTEIEQLQRAGRKETSELHCRSLAGYATRYLGGCEKLSVSIRRIYGRSTARTPCEKQLFKVGLNSSQSAVEHLVAELPQCHGAALHGVSKAV